VSELNTSALPGKPFTGEVWTTEEFLKLNKDIWVKMYPSGKKFYLLRATPDDIDIVDVAHSLANQCRFDGRIKQFYSVAQHSVLASMMMTGLPIHRLAALLHDGPEAYTGDLSRPMKMIGPNPAFNAVNDYITDLFRRRFGLPDESEYKKDLDIVDMSLLKTEDKYLGVPGEGNIIGCEDHAAYGFLEICPWTPARSKAMFMQTFYELWELIK